MDSPSVSTRIHPCFATRTIVQEKEGREERVEIIELVRRGQILADLVQIPSSPSIGKESHGNVLPAKSVILLPGQHTALSATGDSLLATVAGYPKSAYNHAEGKDSMTISLTPLVCVSHDKMEALLTLYPPMPRTAPLEMDELVELIQQEGIRYGLNREILLDCLKQSGEEQKVLHQILIAMGLQPIPGVDAILRTEVEMGSIPGKILGDGRIDFHERRMFIGVRKGQLIATKVPATRGTAGVNVLGDPIGQKEGQDLKVSAGENVLYDEQSGEIRAAKPGVLSMVQNTMKVTSKLTIPGDVNLSTGNIDARDAVEIGGSVQSGFKVIAQGDLVISGGVRSATVVCQGNALVREGVTGKQTTMRVAGDADIVFIEQATITAGGTVLVRKNIYYSQIIAGGDILCQEESRIFGGVTLAGGNLRVGQVGSDNAAPALIAAGTDGKQFLRYNELRREIEKKEDELELALQLHGHDSGLPFHLTMSEELEELHHDLNQMDLATDKRANSQEELAAKLRGRTVSVSGTIVAGTQIRIGNVTMVLETDTAARKFTLSEDLQEIVFLPL
jgi:uncharacterized protein